MKILLSACLITIILAQTTPINPLPTCTSSCNFNTVNVNGFGKISAKPDVGTIDIHLTAAGADTKAATQALSNLQSTVISGLARFGLGNTNYSSSYSVYANYSNKADSPSDYAQIASSYMNIMISTSARSPVTSNQTLISAVVDYLVTQSGVQLNTITYDLTNKNTALNQARAAAYRDAQEKAKDYTSALGLTLGTPTTITDRSSAAAPLVQKFVSAKITMNYSLTNVAVGNIDVTYNLDVVYNFS